MNKDSFYELIHKYISQNITAEELATLRQYIELNQRNRDLFDAFTTSARKSSPHRYLEERADVVLSRETYEGEKTNTTRRMFVFDRLYARITIAALVLILLGALLYMYNYSQTVDNFDQVMQTGKAERLHFVMTDGTKVWLNSESAIHFNKGFGKTNRAITLSGEAYFDVQSNKALPMTIDSRGTSIKVIGTSFNIRAYDDEEATEASLVEGVIELFVKDNTATTEKHILAPGEKLKVFRNKELKIGDKRAEAITSDKSDELIEVAQIVRSHFIHPETKTVPSEIAWKDNKLAFDGEPLEHAISKLEKWYNIKVIVTNSSLADLHVSGTFQDESIEEVLQFLQFSGADFQFITKNNTIYIQ